tara:strand:+ start:674 stop:913 length:240 start_codon:yes stop_codon:yes gene_type:complete
MFEKALKIITILNFLGIVAIFGGSYAGFQYVKSPQFQNKIKNQLMGELKGALPGVVGGQMPKLTSPGIQLPKKSIPSFR